MTSCGGKNRNAHDIEQANLVERVEALEGRVEILVQQLEIMKAKESAKQSGFDVREIEGKK